MKALDELDDKPEYYNDFLWEGLQDLKEEASDNFRENANDWADGADITRIVIPPHDRAQVRAFAMHLATSFCEQFAAIHGTFSVFQTCKRNLARESIRLEELSTQRILEHFVECPCVEYRDNLMRCEPIDVLYNQFEPTPPRFGPLRGLYTSLTRAAHRCYTTDGALRADVCAGVHSLPALLLTISSVV